MCFSINFSKYAAISTLLCLFSSSLAYAADEIVSRPADETKSLAAVLKSVQEPALEPVNRPIPNTDPVIPPSPDQNIPTGTTGAVSKEQEPLQAHAVTLDISSNTLNYDKELEAYTATGDVHVLISEQNSELVADKVIYDQNKDLLVAIGHVIIIKEGQRTYGTYAKIDLTRRSALIKDTEVKVAKVQIKAKTTLADSDYVQMENGKFIIDKQQFAGSFGNRKQRHRVNKQFTQYQSSLKKETDDAADMENPYDLTYSPFSKMQWGSYANISDLKPQSLSFDSLTEGAPAAGPPKSQFSYHVKNIEVRRGQDGYDDITMDWPSILWKGHTLVTMPASDLSYDENRKDLRYLGPEMGYNQNLGGFYGGPSWHFRLGDGFVRLSPIVSFGGGAQIQRSGQNLATLPVGPGAGLVARYRDHATDLDFMYTSKTQQPLLYLNRKLFDDGKTRLLMTWNQNFTDGFVGSERPQYIAQITDTRRVFEAGNVRLDSFGSIGYAKDDFFPTNQKSFFVKPTAVNPIGAGRAQFQLRLATVRPIFQIKNRITFGLQAQMNSAAYSTGDAVALLRAGPNMSITLSSRLSTSIQYFVSKSMGKSPFVFDSYYGGDQNVFLTNSFRINEFLSIGTRQDLNLLRQNDKNAMLIGNMFFLNFGPKDVKFNLAYDFVSQRSYFGVNFFPGNDNGKTNVNFDQLKMFQPVDFNHMMPPSSLPAVSN